MSNKTFGFKTQMAVGDKGEQDFLRHYAKLKPVKSEERAIDFHLGDGKTVELKSDTYPMEKTPNFYFETLSSTDSGKLGGVFRAAADKIDYFVYYYVVDKTFFWFDVPTLNAAVEAAIASGKYKVKTVRNRGWTSEGYALPRSLFEHLLVKTDVLP